LAEITGETVISAISKAIRGSIGTSEIVSIYKNKPEQNAAKPYAFIHQIDTTHTPLLGRRGRRYYIMDIRVHPTEEEKSVNSWAFNLAEKLLSALAYIKLFNDETQIVKATNISWRVESDVLHVITNYNFSVIKTKQEIPDMETLLYGKRVK